MGNEVAGLTELMNKLNNDVTFRPDHGAFRAKLTEIAVADGEVDELFSEGGSDIQVSISGRTADEGIIRILVSSDRGENSSECALSVLNDEEIGDLARQLSRIAAEQLPSFAQVSRKVTARKKAVDGMLTMDEAARRLGCSESFLKSGIPCSDYSYDEIDGKTEIKGYYWSPELIDRLCRIKSGGAKTEDVTYVAGECCHGDSKWAEELLASLAPHKSRGEGTVPDGVSKAPGKEIPRAQRHRRPSHRKKT